jgi:hypothetical protein
MPQVRKLAPEEVQAIENKGKGTRKITEEQYDRFLAEYELGDYGEAELDEDEKRLTVRNRLKAAASRRDAAIEFKRTHGNTIRFRVVAPESIAHKVKRAIAQVPALISSELPKSKGRPKKTA